MLLDLKAVLMLFEFHFCGLFAETYHFLSQEDDNFVPLVQKRKENWMNVLSLQEILPCDSCITAVSIEGKILALPKFA